MVIQELKYIRGGSGHGAGGGGSGRGAGGGGSGSGAGGGGRGRGAGGGGSGRGAGGARGIKVNGLSIEAVTATLMNLLDSRTRHSHSRPQKVTLCTMISLSVKDNFNI